MIGLPHTSMRLYIFARRAWPALALPGCHAASLLCSALLSCVIYANVKYFEMPLPCERKQTEVHYKVSLHRRLPPSPSHSGKCYLANQQTELCPNMTGVSLSLSPSLRLSLSLPLFWFANNYSNYGIFGILSLFLLSIGWNRWNKAAAAGNALLPTQLHILDERRLAPYRFPLLFVSQSESSAVCVWVGEGGGAGGTHKVHFWDYWHVR